MDARTQNSEQLSKLACSRVCSRNPAVSGRGCLQTIFSNHLDGSAHQLIAIYGQYGFPNNMPYTLGSIIKIGAVGIFISPLVIPITVIALGEEIGWRFYLLPNLLKLTSTSKAVFLDGVLWGLCHAPLIYFGFNYGADYWGAPWVGMIMMVMVCSILGIWFSYFTIKTKSVLPASIMHGAANPIGEWPALVAFSSANMLLGPNRADRHEFSIVGWYVLFNAIVPYQNRWTKIMHQNRGRQHSQTFLTAWPWIRIRYSSSS